MGVAEMGKDIKQLFLGQPALKPSCKEGGLL